MTEAQQPQPISQYSPEQVQQIFAQHMDWVDNIYDTDGEEITQLSEITRPHTIRRVTEDGEIVEQRSAFNADQRNCIKALLNDVHAVITLSDSYPGLIAYVRSTFADRENIGASVKHNLLDEEEFEGLMSVNQYRYDDATETQTKQYKRSDMYYALKIMEHIYKQTLAINPTYEYVWKSLVHFDIMGIFILLQSITTSVGDIAESGSSHENYNVGFSEELETTIDGQPGRLKSYCPFSGFVLRVGQIVNSYTEDVIQD